jgi:hypothetical protein
MNGRSATIVAGASLALVARPALANVGVPLIAVFLPPMWVALLLVIIVEALVNSRLLAVPLRRTIVPAGIGNIASAVVGIPILWIVLAAGEGLWFGSALGLETLGDKLYAVTIQSPWLIPYEDDLGWMIPTALAVFLVPCYLLSVVIEAPANRLGLAELPARSVWRATALSNLASYLILGVLLAAELLLQEQLEPIQSNFMPIIGGMMMLVFGAISIFTRK